MNISRKGYSASEYDKGRIRREIDAQIAAYLRAGGKIDVVGTEQSSRKAPIGSVWHGSEDIPGLYA